MVAMFAPQVLGPQCAELLPKVKEPMDTYNKLGAISCPLLVMHGQNDEIVPCAQGQRCHEIVQCQDKKLRVWPGAGHNDVLMRNMSEWQAEVIELLGKAVAFENEIPAGAQVEAHSLSTAALNGLRGIVLGPQGERIRVQFAEPNGEKALKAANLKVLDRAYNPFPVGAVVEAHSLSTASLNGMRGTVLGATGERIRVAFPEPSGEKALKPANLKRIEE